MGVAQHGREDGRVGVVWRVMARVMARGRGELGGPGDGGQLEQVLREGVVVGERAQGHPADGEGESGNYERMREGCVDQMTVLESLLLACRVCRGGDFILITFAWFLLDCQIQPGLVGVVRLWLRDGVIVQHEGVGVADPGEGGVGAAVRGRHRRGLWRVAGREVVRGELGHLAAQP